MGRRRAGTEPSSKSKVCRERFSSGNDIQVCVTVKERERDRETKRQYVIFDMWLIVSFLGKVLFENDVGENLGQ